MVLDGSACGPDPGPQRYHTRQVDGAAVGVHPEITAVPIDESSQLDLRQICHGATRQ
jgi:hypothetical protein